MARASPTAASSSGRPRPARSPPRQQRPAPAQPGLRPRGSGRRAPSHALGGRGPDSRRRRARPRAARSSASTCGGRQRDRRGRRPRRGASSSRPRSGRGGSWAIAAATPAASSGTSKNGCQRSGSRVSALADEAAVAAAGVALRASALGQRGVERAEQLGVEQLVAVGRGPARGSRRACSSAPRAQPAAALDQVDADRVDALRVELAGLARAACSASSKRPSSGQQLGRVAAAPDALAPAQAQLVADPDALERDLRGLVASGRRSSSTLSRLTRARAFSSTSSSSSSAIRMAVRSSAMPSSTRPRKARSTPRLQRAWPSMDRPSGTCRATSIACARELPRTRRSGRPASGSARARSAPRPGPGSAAASGTSATACW